jgi:hypothetical protein
VESLICAVGRSCSGAGFSQGLAASEEFWAANTENAPRNASLPLEQVR